jgi:hypothetical protein
LIGPDGHLMIGLLRQRKLSETQQAEIKKALKEDVNIYPPLKEAMASTLDLLFAQKSDGAYGFALICYTILAECRTMAQMVPTLHPDSVNELKRALLAERTSVTSLTPTAVMQRHAGLIRPRETAPSAAPWTFPPRTIVVRGRGGVRGGRGFPPRPPLRM